MPPLSGTSIPRTYYFRTHFNFTGSAAGLTAALLDAALAAIGAADLPQGPMGGGTALAGGRNSSSNPGRRRRNQVRVALEALIGHLRPSQHPRVRRTVRLVAGRAGLGPDRRVFVDERAALVGMAGVALLVHRLRLQHHRGERAVRIVAVGAVEAPDIPLAAIPVTTGATMGAGVPIADRRAVAAAAKLRALGEFQLVAVAHLQGLEVGLVVAVVAEVVPVVRAVPHHDVGVLVGDKEVVLVVETKRRGLVALVTDIAVVV